MTDSNRDYDMDTSEKKEDENSKHMPHSEFKELTESEHKGFREFADLAIPISSTDQPSNAEHKEQSGEERSISKPDGQEDIHKPTTPSDADSSTSTMNPRLNVVFFGNSSSVQFGHENILLGEKQIENRKISDYHITVINMIDLHEGEHEVPLIGQLLNEKEIHAFIFIVRLGQLTDADKIGLEWLQRVFGDKVLQFVVILFTYETEEECDSIIDDLKNNTNLEQLLEKCGGRYHTCNKMMNNQSEMKHLVDKIEHLFNDNQQCYSRERLETEEPKTSESGEAPSLRGSNGSTIATETEDNKRSGEEGSNSKPDSEADKTEEPDMYSDPLISCKGGQSLTMEDTTTKTVERHEDNKQSGEEGSNSKPESEADKIEKSDMYSDPLISCKDQSMTVEDTTTKTEERHKDNKRSGEEGSNSNSDSGADKTEVPDMYSDPLMSCKGDQSLTMEDTTTKTVEIHEVKSKASAPSDQYLQQQVIEQAKHLLHRLHLEDGPQNKLQNADVFQITVQSLQSHEACAEEELIQIFIQKLLMINYKVRNINVKDRNEQEELQQNNSESYDDEVDIFDDALKNTSLSEKGQTQPEPVHPMDVQMAAFHCADGFLKQMMVTKLSQCQFALPLLVPDPFTQQIEFPLWTFRQINKSWKIRDANNETISQTQPIYKAQTPMVFFFRFGSVSSSKSQLMNSLINEKHNTFFHRNCPGSSRSRVLMDGVVEIAWFCPSGTNDDTFTDCVAFCNLHGDAGDHEKQWKILTEMASVNVVLLPQIDKNDRNAEKIQNLYKDSKPLICLLSEDECAVKEMRKRKYKTGLKERNQSDVSKELRRAISDCLSESSSTFSLEDVSKHSDIRVDEEDDEDCRRGRAAAQQMMSSLEKKELTEIKESFLPHQGKLWHQWSQKNKQLHRPYGNELEMEISRKKSEMKTIREQQYKFKICEFMKLFFKEIISNAECEKLFFLKWLRILLDEHTSADLSDLHHKYNNTWSDILKMKDDNEKSQLEDERTKLERISEELQAATFGFEHIMREIGQIFESCSHMKKNKKDLPADFSSLPGLAAEMMISGFPLELMDGDAAHVPLVWISAVLDQLLQKLGDQRVFVLSVLGIQSSGKSTMLNAMFGLQFAVSAGRCTRGAFMQLVKVSDEMKTQQNLNFDYILVVDTEGLRAPELAGRSTRHHDNELATFVVGVGNLTLINIFGENLAEMQDVLQIVVQAFMRMKKIRLKSSCVFVHQNVSDITAGERNMEGRRRLLQTLDEMTKLAAKDEDSDAERFSDIISFDIQKDVRYFAQLWEGSPPMAPPNPKYCENIQELKNTVLSKASTSGGVTLSEFKWRVNDLWEALLNENFVFSFKNILEIAVYRRLENKYSNWTWTFRSTMSKIEEKFHNRIANGKYEVEESDLLGDMNETKEAVQKLMVSYFEEDKDREILSQWRARFEGKIADLHDDLIKKAKRTLDEVIQQKKTRKNLDAKKAEYENKLFCLSKELALQLKSNAGNEQQTMKEFDSVWSTWITDLVKDTPPVKEFDFWKDVKEILGENLELTLLEGRKSRDNYKRIDCLGDYSDYIMLKKNVGLLDQDQSPEQPDSSSKHQAQDKKSSYLSSFISLVKAPFQALKTKREVQTKQGESQNKVLLPEDNNSIMVLITSVIQQTNKTLEQAQRADLGYHHSNIQEMTTCVQENIKKYQDEKKTFKLKKEFTVDLCLYVCDRAHEKFHVLHNKFKNANDPRSYLEQQKPQYYSVFKSCCKGATTTAIFGEFICSELESSILQAVYNKTAIDLSDLMKSDLPAFNGNRSNLEKHILKKLAEEEDFKKYMKYIHNPRDYFEGFIKREVNKFINEQHQTVLNTFKNNLKLKEQTVSTALINSIAEVKKNRGNAGVWQKRFTETLTDEMKFIGNSCVELSEITDLEFLEKILAEGLKQKMSNIHNGLKSIDDVKMEKCRKKPDELLIDHLCRCCWVQCPFCKAICTNTIENHHEGPDHKDHSVPFHRVKGINGIIFRNTTNLSIHICTTSVASSTLSFYSKDSDESVLWKDYKKAKCFANWSITTDVSELPYWKWFVCRFKKDLEKLYNYTFEGSGEIPSEWKDHSKESAIQSLEKYI